MSHARQRHVPPNAARDSEGTEVPSPNTSSKAASIWPRKGEPAWLLPSTEDPQGWPCHVIGPGTSPSFWLVRLLACDDIGVLEAAVTELHEFSAAYVACCDPWRFGGPFRRAVSYAAELLAPTSSDRLPDCSAHSLWLLRPAGCAGDAHMLLTVEPCEALTSLSDGADGGCCSSVDGTSSSTFGSSSSDGAGSSSDVAAISSNGADSNDGVSVRGASSNRCSNDRGGSSDGGGGGSDGGGGGRDGDTIVADINSVTRGAGRHAAGYPRRRACGAVRVCALQAGMTHMQSKARVPFATADEEVPHAHTPRSMCRPLDARRLSIISPAALAAAAALANGEREAAAEAQAAVGGAPYDAVPVTLVVPCEWLVEAPRCHIAPFMAGSTVRYFPNMQRHRLAQPLPPLAAPLWQRAPPLPLQPPPTRPTQLPAANPVPLAAAPLALPPTLPRAADAGEEGDEGEEAYVWDVRQGPCRLWPRPQLPSSDHSPKLLSKAERSTLLRPSERWYRLHVPLRGTWHWAAEQSLRPWCDPHVPFVGGGHTTGANLSRRRSRVRHPRKVFKRPKTAHASSAAIAKPSFVSSVGGLEVGPSTTVQPAEQVANASLDEHGQSEAHSRDYPAWREWHHDTAALVVQSCSWDRVFEFLRLTRSACAADEHAEFNIDYIIRQIETMQDGPAADEAHVMLQLRSASNHAGVRDHTTASGCRESSVLPASMAETLGVVAATVRMSRRLITLEFRAIYVLPRLRRQRLAEALVHFTLEDLRQQVLLGMQWTAHDLETMVCFVTLPHCMQTSAQFWSRIGFEIGKAVDPREQKQATLRDSRCLKGCIAQWQPARLCPSSDRSQS